MSYLQDIANLRPLQIDTENDGVYDPPLLALDIPSAGDVSIVLAGSGDTFNASFPDAANGGQYPYRWWVRIQQIPSTAIEGLIGIQG